MQNEFPVSQFDEQDQFENCECEEQNFAKQQWLGKVINDRRESLGGFGARK